MVEINFFEKTQKNILPYILAGTFFIILTLIGIYFNLMHDYYAEQTQNDSQWVLEQSENVVLSRQIEVYDRLTRQSVQAQETLLDSQYPMVFVTEDLSSLLSDELKMVSAFQHSESGQVVVVLENTSITAGSNLIDAIEARPYVDRVQLLRIENQMQENSDFQIEMTIDINETALREEVLQ